MNKFVNFGKRSIDLPVGCKDLADVLLRAKERPAPSLTTCSVEGLAGLTRHLNNLTETGAKTENLAISWHDDPNHVHLTNEQGIINAIIVIHDNTQLEQAVREVFEEAGLAPILDKSVAGFCVRVLRYSLAGEPSIGELIPELLRRGYGLAENVRLEIGCWKDDPS